MGKLIRISRWLGRVPSLGYGLVYILLIPVFAIIYYYLPYHFYHSTVQYERSLSGDSEDILRGLRDEMIANLRRIHNPVDVPSPSGWRVDEELLDFHSLKVTGDEVSFSMTVQIENINRKRDSWSLMPLIIKFPWRDKYSTLSPGNETPNENKFITIEGIPDVPDLLGPKDRQEISRYLFPYGYITTGSDVVIMHISDELNNKLVSYTNAVQGFPSEMRGSFVRMFYLSAVTITTLGYGDIVPITTTSRLIISAESILGIVIIGLFLNALGYQARDAQPHA
jgi:hypothetical protein